MSTARFSFTTNLAFKNWGTVFPNATCATALIDRLIHHVEIITITGESYRRREAEAAQKARQGKAWARSAGVQQVRVGSVFRNQRSARGALGSRRTGVSRRSGRAADEAVPGAALRDRLARERDALIGDAGARAVRRRGGWGCACAAERWERRWSRRDGASAVPTLTAPRGIP